MLSFRDLSEDTALFPWNKVTAFPAIEATTAVSLLILVGELTGQRAAASIAAGAAFTVGFAVFHEALSSALLSMAALTLGIASATFAGSFGGHWVGLPFALCLLAALNYGLLSGLGPTSTWIGQQCGVYVVISSYFSSDLAYAAGRSAMVLLGGILQMVVFVVWRLLQRKRVIGKTPALPLARQVHTRARQLLHALHGELRWSAGSTSYSIKLCITLGLSTLLYKHYGWRNGYWAPMTAMLVLKPKWANTLSRGIARLAGTLVGAAVTVWLAHLFPPFRHEVYFALVVLTAYGCFALQAVNYALFSAVLTTYTVFLFGFGGFSERSAADYRLLNTAVGGLLALLVDGIPRWWNPAPPATDGPPAAVSRAAADPAVSSGESPASSPGAAA